MAETPVGTTVPDGADRGGPHDETDPGPASSRPDQGPRHRAFSPRSWSRRARWIGGAAAVVVVVAVVLVWRAGTSSGTTTPVLARASTGTLRQTVGATGTIAPAQRADLDFAVPGRVTAVPVTVGQQVAAGDTLATVDAASLPQQVAQADAGVASAQARLDADSGASAAQRDADSAALTAAQAQLSVAQRNLSQATLTAPFAGTVAAVDVAVGQQVPAGGSGSASSGSGGSASGGSGSTVGSGTGTSSSTGTTADVVVISTGTFVVNASVDDTEVAALKAGQAAEVTPTGAARPVTATVTSVGLVATSTSGVATYPVTLAVTGDTSTLHVGATAQVSIVVSQVDDAVLVPAAAVHGSGADASVLVDTGGTQTSTKVTVGA
ncbi:efflux RND transporter periplasmic adaptor subunit, partial [Pseudonocardia sp. N23]|uniref:efflux RND transporter periplasmic adaptor subunit n=1 Tax=Pseudonocardia sp. N23 TaxID=1987376 RepID=UPI000BFE6418